MHSELDDDDPSVAIVYLNFISPGVYPISLTVSVGTVIVVDVGVGTESTFAGEVVSTNVNVKIGHCGSDDENLAVSNAIV